MPDEDLIIGEENTEEVTEEIQMDFTSNSEYIQSCYFALTSVEDIDTAIISKADELRIKSIKRKCLRIIYECVTEMYDEIFDSEENTE
jgi:hypothetical protein